MRIIAGRYKGRVLKAPKGRLVRPTSERVREAIFSVLGMRVEGSNVLDLFAGSGALGLEALSRGATFVVFVERSARVVGLIKSNIATLNARESAEVWCMDVRNALKNLPKKGYTFDIVFLDPPYRRGIPEKILNMLGEGRLLAREAMVVVEHEADCEMRVGYGCLVLFSRKNYGDTSVSFYVKA